jgi:hypothetical protein
MGEWVVEHHLWPARRQRVIEAVEVAATEAGPGAELLIATGSYQPVGDAFARRIGAHGALGTPLELRDGIATGALAVPTQSGERKASAILARAAAGDRRRSATPPATSRCRARPPGHGGRARRDPPARGRRARLRSRGRSFRRNPPAADRWSPPPAPP